MQVISCFCNGGSIPAVRLYVHSIISEKYDIIRNVYYTVLYYMLQCWRSVSLMDQN